MSRFLNHLQLIFQNAVSNVKHRKRVQKANFCIWAEWEEREHKFNCIVHFTNR